MILDVTDVVNKLILKGSVLFAARSTRPKVHLILKYINHSRADAGIVRQVNGSHVTDYIAEKILVFSDGSVVILVQHYTNNDHEWI